MPDNNPEAMTKQVRSDNDVLYISEKGKTTPSEILDTLTSINAEGRPIWKPMHLQPIFRMNPICYRKTVMDVHRQNAYIVEEYSDVATDIFNRGLCLPSDIKMTIEEQEKIIEVIRSCFN